jgi:hypothetical protein
MNDENVNPYMVCDGPWGGFGYPSRWQRFKWSKRNVFERRYGFNDNWEYVKVWDDGLKRWREITVEEKIKLPMKKHPTREEVKLSREAYVRNETPKIEDYIDRFYGTQNFCSESVD